MSICMYKFLLTRINKLIIECLTGIFLKCYITFLAFIPSSSSNTSFEHLNYEMYVFKFQRGTNADESSRYHCTVKPHTFISFMVLTQGRYEDNHIHLITISNLKLYLCCCCFNHGCGLLLSDKCIRYDEHSSCPSICWGILILKFLILD